MSETTVNQLPDAAGSDSTSVGADVAAALDQVLARPVLVVGSPPPHGNDLDLLARPDDHESVRRWLEQAGFVSWRHTWARFDEPGLFAVDLSTTKDWWRGRDDVSCLFAEPRPIPGLRHLVRPGPAAALLLAARSLVARRGNPSDKITRRVAQALETDPEAWSVAEGMARPLGLLGPLRLLRQAYESGTAVGAGARAAALTRVLLESGPLAAKARILLAAGPRRVRPALISFSGLDGSGKSTQASQLQRSLRDLGISSQMQWAGFKTGRVFLRAAPFMDRPIGRKRNPARQPDRLIPPAFLYTSTGRHAWVVIVVLGNVVHLWRLVLRRRQGTKVLIFDRFSPDTMVKFDLWFYRGRNIDIRWQRKLFTLISPKPDVGFFVDVSSPVAYSRRQEETPEQLADMAELYQEQVARFGLHRLDGTRPPEELSEHVAVSAWRDLR